VAILSVMRCCKATVALAEASLAAASLTIARAGAMEVGDREERIENQVWP
jgi:hypothetical protein